MSTPNDHADATTILPSSIKYRQNNEQARGRATRRTHSLVNPKLTYDQPVQPQGHNAEPGENVCGIQEPSHEDTLVRYNVLLEALREDLSHSQRISEDRVERLAGTAVRLDRTIQDYVQYQRDVQKDIYETTRALSISAHPTDPIGIVREITERLTAAEVVLSDLGDALRHLITDGIFVGDTYIGKEVPNKPEGYSNVRAILATLHDSIVITPSEGENPVRDLLKALKTGPTADYVLEAKEAIAGSHPSSVKNFLNLLNPSPKISPSNRIIIRNPKTSNVAILNLDYPVGAQFDSWELVNAFPTEEELKVLGHVRLDIKPNETIGDLVTRDHTPLNGRGLIIAEEPKTGRKTVISLDTVKRNQFEQYYPWIVINSEPTIREADDVANGSFVLTPSPEQ